MSDEDINDKPHDPTPKKLEDARKKGEVAKSTDLNAAANYGGLVLAIFAAGTFSLEGIGGNLSALLSQSSQLSQELFTRGGNARISGAIRSSLVAVLPLFLLPMLAVLLSIFAQRSLIFAPDKVFPKGSRISILGNAKNKFGRAGLFEFGKSTIKLCLYGLLLALLLQSNIELLVALPSFDEREILHALFSLILQFLILSCIVTVLLGGIDYLWQLQEHIRKNRMSHREMMDENKSSEGDPHLKNQRRQRGYEIAMGQMMADVPTADVIIVNPTHYAVALKWDRNSGGAPHCIAKGVDHVAAKIREVAQEAGVPIHSDPPTARALFAQVEIGQEIQPDLFKPVAVAIRFAEAMRMKAGKYAK